MHRCKHIPQPLKANSQTKAVVRATTSPIREKLFFKISFPSKNLKNANPQTDIKTFGQLVQNLILPRVARPRRQERQGITSPIRKQGFRAS
jgi:hypothetical protein